METVEFAVCLGILVEFLYIAVELVRNLDVENWKKLSENQR